MSQVTVFVERADELKFHIQRTKSCSKLGTGTGPSSIIEREHILLDTARTGPEDDDGCPGLDKIPS